MVPFASESAFLFAAIAAIVALGGGASAHGGPAHSFLGPLSGMNRAEKEACAPRHPPIVQRSQPGARLSSQPPVLDARGFEGVTLSFEGVANATADDFITVSCGPALSPSDYLDRINASSWYNASSGAPPPSRGSVRVPQLVNMRCAYAFAYVRGSSYEIVADATVPVAGDYRRAPMHGHLALGDGPSQMWVSFTSGSADVAPAVRYGLSPGSLGLEATGNSTTYRASDMCAAHANVTSQQLFRDPGYIHHVLLDGLAPNTTYHYAYGFPGGAWGDTASFTTALAPSASAGVRMIAYADQGIDFGLSAAATTANALADVVSRGYTGPLLHFGDISYARGEGYMWEAYFEMVEPLARRVPYMVSVGNHEMDNADASYRPWNNPSGVGLGWHPSWGNFGNDSRGECGVPVYHRFRAPTSGNGLFWYSFDHGNVHVVQISSEHDWLPGSAQYRWLEADLAAVDRSATPWVVLTSHRMMYTTQLRENNDKIVSVHMQEAFDALLQKYGVNLMLSGHQHSFQASAPVFNNVTREPGQATVHVIVGTAGAGREHGGFSTALGDYEVASTQDHWGYLRLDTTTPDVLHVEFFANDLGSVWYETDIPPWVGL